MKNESSNIDPQFVWNVLLKGILLFLLICTLFVFIDPLPVLGRLSIYNLLFPGRLRLPYGENPPQSYNLSLNSIDAMLASHLLSADHKPSDEYRVLLIGDSSLWGFLLEPDQTLSENLNSLVYTLPDGRIMRFYNLGYPVMSLMKDLLILSHLSAYEPDMVVWLFTLESFPYDKQLFAPILQNNPEPVRELIRSEELSIDPNHPDLVDIGFLDRTLIGLRRDLADLVRLQLYGVMWAATDIDQHIPTSFTPRMEDLPADLSFHNLSPPRLGESDLALEILRAGMRISSNVPMILVNEPMFISNGENSDIRYNFYYPRWAYDDYRRIMSAQATKNNWIYIDAWDMIPASEFTNTAVHLTPKGSELLAEHLGPIIHDLAINNP